MNSKGRNDMSQPLKANLGTMLQQSVYVLARPSVASFERFERSGGAAQAFTYVAVVALVLDLATKVYVVAELEGQRVVDLGLLRIAVSRNPGAAFSFAEGATLLFTTVAVVVVRTMAAISPPSSGRRRASGARRRSARASSHRSGGGTCGATAANIATVTSSTTAGCGVRSSASSAHKPHRQPRKQPRQRISANAQQRLSSRTPCSGPLETQ